MANIIILIPKLNARGGVEKIVTEYANWIENNTNATISIVKLNNGHNTFAINKNIPVIQYNYQAKTRLGNIIARLSFCKKTFRRLNPDIVYCTYAKPIIIAKLTKPRKCRIIGSEHSVPKYRGLHEKILRYASSVLCDGFIFQTNDVKKDFPKTIQKKSIVIPNPAAIISSAKNIKKENLILSIGRLEKVKAFDELIKACAPFLRKNPSYKLKIIGDGSEKKNIELLIKRLKLEHSVFIIHNAEHPEFQMAKAKLFVTTSRYEGFSNVLIEAMTTGTCCISYDCDYGPRNIIEQNINGVLIPQNNIELLSKTIESLLSNNAKRTQLEKNAKNKSKMFAPNHIFNQYFLYFNKIGDK